MKEMSQLQQGMDFYGQMPDMYAIVLNTDHRIIKEVLSDSNDKLHEELKPVLAELKGQHARKQVLEQQQKDKKYDELTQEEKDEMSACEQNISDEEKKRDDILAEYGKGNDKVHQLVDLALLQNGLLKGEALNNFLRRSISLL